jgi:hypothetical protein
MPIPGPGTALSVNAIAAEFGGTVPHSLSEYYRGGALVGNTPTNAAIPTSGQISIGNFYGSAAGPSRVAIPIVINNFRGTYNLYTNRGPTYVAGQSDITLTLGPTGELLNNSNTYALLVPNEFNPADTVTIVNNGYIYGAGGPGGAGGAAMTAPASQHTPSASAGIGGNGTRGGDALYVNRPVTVQNNGTIAGGGGGGGGGGARTAALPPTKPASPNRRAAGGGGGGGGGAVSGQGTGGTLGSAALFSGPLTNVVLAPGQSGSQALGGVGGSGGGGGDTLPSSPVGRIIGGPGGVGGSTGSAGSAGGATTGITTPAFYVQKTGAPGSGGPAGNYITGNPFVTWTANGTRLGGVA